MSLTVKTVGGELARNLAYAVASSVASMATSVSVAQVIYRLSAIIFGVTCAMQVQWLWQKRQVLTPTFPKIWTLLGHSFPETVQARVWEPLIGEDTEAYFLALGQRSSRLGRAWTRLRFIVRTARRFAGVHCVVRAAQFTRMFRFAWSVVAQK